MSGPSNLYHYKGLIRPSLPELNFSFLTGALNLFKVTHMPCVIIFDVKVAIPIVPIGFNFIQILTFCYVTCTTPITNTLVLLSTPFQSEIYTNSNPGPRKVPSELCPLTSITSRLPLRPMCHLTQWCPTDLIYNSGTPFFLVLKECHLPGEEIFIV